LCREEARELSSLKPRLDELGIRLVGVTHQTIGVPEFMEFFQGGEVFYDRDKAFFKAVGERWQSALSLLRPRVWMNTIRALKKNIMQNTQGEGLLMGGLLVIAPDGAVTYRYFEKVIGDHAPLSEVRNAIESMAQMRSGDQPRL